MKESPTETAKRACECWTVERRRSLPDTVAPNYVDFWACRECGKRFIERDPVLIALDELIGKLTR